MFFMFLLRPLSLSLLLPINGLLMYYDRADKVRACHSAFNWFYCFDYIVIVYYLVHRWTFTADFKMRRCSGSVIWIPLYFTCCFLVNFFFFGFAVMWWMLQIKITCLLQEVNFMTYWVNPRWVVFLCWYLVTKLTNLKHWLNKLWRMKCKHILGHSNLPCN